MSAGEGPGRRSQRVQGQLRRFFGYVARGVPFGPDDGTISPPAMVASVPFAPELVLAGIRHVCRHYPSVAEESGIRNGVNPTLADGSPECWLSPALLGLDQGIVLLMIESHRSQLLWSLMRQCSYIPVGLRQAGFKGGWL